VSNGLSNGYGGEDANRQHNCKLPRTVKIARVYDDLDDSAEGSEDDYTTNSSATDNSTCLSRPWTDEEDNRLRDAVKMLGEHKWTKMAQSQFSHTRNAQQCRQRWTKVLRPGIKKGAWAREEDAQLRQAVRQALEQVHSINKIQWNAIAAEVPTRTYAMCRERWKNYLDSSINHADFTPEEQQKLEGLHDQFGNQHSIIARHMPGRTSEKIKAWARARARATVKRRKKAEKKRSAPPRRKPLSLAAKPEPDQKPNAECKEEKGESEERRQAKKKQKIQEEVKIKEEKVDEEEKKGKGKKVARPAAVKKTAPAAHCGGNSAACAAFASSGHPPVFNLVPLDDTTAVALECLENLLDLEMTDDYQKPMNVYMT
jgi:hypothetical protein